MIGTNVCVLMMVIVLLGVVSLKVQCHGLHETTVSCCLS